MKADTVGITPRTIFVNDPRWSPGSPALRASFNAAVAESEQVVSAACRKCGAPITALDKSGMCQDCLLDRVNGAGVLEDDLDDDLFSAPRAAAPITHAITCVVCGTATRIYIAAPGDLCDVCRADLPAMRTHVEDVVELARLRLHTLIASFDDALARESEKDQGRWKDVEAARVAVHKKRLDAAILRSRLVATLALGDGLSRILVAHASYEADCGEVEAVEAWAERAMGEIAIAGGIQ
jgi:ribosomal protein S14